MPSINAYLVADWPKGGTTVFRLRIGDGQKGWITKITNKTLGPLWFPRLGDNSYNIHNPAATLRVDSVIDQGAPMGPSELTTVYGSPTPVFPVEIVAIIDYGGTDEGDDNTDQEPPQAQPDGSIPITGGDDMGNADDTPDNKYVPTLAYMEVGVDYKLAAPVQFNAAIRVDKHDPFQNDGCGHLYQLVGSTIVFSPMIDSIIADGVITSTSYRWHVTGAEVTGGVVDADTDGQPLTLALTTPGTTSVTLDVTITSTIGTGIDVLTETGTRTSTYQLYVITQLEAGVARAVCRLLQETLPIHHLIFPGDPARSRGSPAQQRALARLSARVSANAAALVQRLDQLSHQ
jgi:hypothetical protein